MAGRVMLNPWVYGRSGRNPVKIKTRRRSGESWIGIDVIDSAGRRITPFGVWPRSDRRGRYYESDSGGTYPTLSAAKIAAGKWATQMKINPRRSRRRNLPLTVYVGRKRHTRSALIKKFGALKGSRYWRQAKLKYHGYGKFGARCKTRRRRLNSRGKRR